MYYRKKHGSKSKTGCTIFKCFIFDELNPIAKPYFTDAVRENWQNLINIYGNPLPYNIVKEQSLWYQANKNFIKDLRAWRIRNKEQVLFMTWNSI